MYVENTELHTVIGQTPAYDNKDITQYGSTVYIYI